MTKRRGDISEEEKKRRRNELEEQKRQQRMEIERLFKLMSNPYSDRTTQDEESFFNNFGHLNFFKEYISEGNKGLVRSAFMKADLQTHLKSQFITRKGEENKQLMVILEGQVGVYLEIKENKTNNKTNNNNKKQLIFIKKLLQGETIELGSLISGNNYLMTTQAMTDTVTLFTLNQNSFNKIFYKYESNKFDADINFLKAVPFISDWPLKNLITLQMCISKFSVPKSQIIYQEGQSSQALFIVKEGEFGQYKKRHFWQRNGNIEKGDVIDYTEKIKKTGSDSDNISESNLPKQPLKRGMSSAEISKKISDFLATGSVVEMNSDLVQTFNVFDSFGEKELLNNIPRQYSVVCKSNEGELIQIKSRHFFILTQEERELKFQIMTKMMIDYKKQEIQHMRSNLTFQGENEILMLDNYLNNIDNIQHQVNVINNSNDNDDNQQLQYNSFYNKSIHSKDEININKNNNQHKYNKSQFTINKFSLNPNNTSQSLQSIQKFKSQNIYQQYINNPKQSSQQQQLGQDLLQNNNNQGLIKKYDINQIQRKSCLVTDLTCYLQKNKDFTQTFYSENNQTDNHQNNNNFDFTKAVMKTEGNFYPRKIKISRNSMNSPSFRSNQKLDLFNDKNNNNYDDDDNYSQHSKLPQLRPNYSSFQNESSPKSNCYTTRQQSISNISSDKSQNYFLTSSKQKRFEYSMMRSSTNNSNNHINNNNLNGNCQKNNNNNPFFNSNQIDFFSDMHLNGMNCLPSNKYSSRPYIHSIDYSSYSLNL